MAHTRSLQDTPDHCKVASLSWEDLRKYYVKMAVTAFVLHSLLSCAVKGNEIVSRWSESVFLRYPTFSGDFRDWI